MQQPQAMQIEATLPVAITLTAAQWLQLRLVLTKGPYDLVSPLIMTIDQQLEIAAASPGMFRPGNGEAVTRLDD